MQSHYFKTTGEVQKSSHVKFEKHVLKTVKIQNLEKFQIFQEIPRFQYSGHPQQQKRRRKSSFQDTPEDN